MRLLLPTLALLAPVATAPAVAVLEPLRPCYVSVPTGPDRFDTEPVDVIGRGFTPGATVNVAIDGEDVAPGVPVGTDGTIDGSVAAPGLSTGERLFTVSATEPGNLAQTASVTALVTDLTARIAPRRASPRRRVRFSGRGFTDLARPVYAHYARRGEVRRTVRLARTPTGDCGRFSVRRRQFPFRPRPGRWTIFVDQSSEQGTQTPTVSIGVRVRRARR